MAVCPYCEQEMTDAASKSCKLSEVEFPDGATLPAIPWPSRNDFPAWTTQKWEEPFNPDEYPERCGDCGVSKGGFHHPGCGYEKCPRCGWQLISCGCLRDDDEEVD